MKYISIDIETTGLNPETCQILEIGAIVENGYSCFPPKFHCYVDNGTVIGEPFALDMNKRILEHIAKNRHKCLKPYQVASAFFTFLKRNGFGDKINVAGKNYQSFDARFLSKLPRWDELIKIGHRVIDPAILYWNPDIDETLPSLRTCMKRAGIKGEVPHNAIADARIVIQLIRNYYAENRSDKEVSN